MNKISPRRGRILVSGALAGLVNGLFGGGGGMVLLPLLRGWCALETHSAMATCVGIIAPVCAVSAALYLRQGTVELSLAWPYLLGGFLGGILAGKTLARVNPAVLRKLFGLVLLWGGVRQWL